ncbi:Spartin [Geodia barretti]|uniref:Spartin n=1 Tax=Geodia barretti TaxID=519541 RepID=A0AA35SKE8_GEOBA|nr:Spartin [Geodia barretti]
MATMQQQRRPGTQSQATRDPIPSAPPQYEVLYPSLSSTTASTTTVDSLSTRRLTLAQSYFDTAKNYVSEALSKDERGERMEALELYNQVLSTLSLGLGQVRNGTGPGMTELRNKLVKMRDQVKARMEILLEQEIQSRQEMSASVADRSPKPVSRTGQTSLTTSTTSRAGSSTAESAGGTRQSAKADLVFNVDSGIGLFQVDKQDHVRKFEDVDTLSVFRYHDRIKGQPPAFLQCGGFIYPLIPGRSPVLKASENVYMFPDLKGEDGCTVGLTLEGSIQRRNC